VKLNKITPYTKINILIGYKNYNIWRIYFPGYYKTKIICLSYVRFDERDIIIELSLADNKIPETRNKKEIVQDFYNYNKKTNKPIQPISKILFNKNQ
jgi:hypothetical protein